MNLGHWVKHLLIYGSGVVLMNALPLLLIPIYTHAISTSEYGVVELLNRSQDLLIVIFSLGLRSTLLTLYQMAKDDTQRRRALYSTALELLFASTLILILVLMAFSPQLSTILFGVTEFRFFVLVILAATYFEVLFQIAALYLQSELMSKTYVFTFAARSILTIVTNLVLVYWFKMGLKGILLSTLIQTSLSTIVLLFFVFRRIGFTFERSLLPDMLKFGLPLVPAAILMFIMNNGDRYFLNLFTSRDQVGIYGLGYRLGVVTTNLVLFPFGKVWSVVMVSISENEDGAHRLGRISTYLMAALTFSNLGMSLMSPYVVSTLAADQYHDAYKVVALIGASYLLYAWTTVMDASFYITKRTGYKPLILLISGVVMFALYSWLIPKYGMMGAAWATLGGFIAFTCVTLFSAQRIYRIHYEWVRMAKLMTLAVLLYLAGSSIPPENLGSSLALRVAAILVFIAVVCSDFIAQPWEREFVMSYLKTTWTRFMARNKEAEAKAEA